MDAVTNDYIPWRERAFVSVSEAAAIFSRSTTWVRNRIVDCSLEAFEPGAGGPTAVTVTSVVALIDRTTNPQAEPSKPGCSPVRLGSHLRLVINNTPK
jgi:hypothetical protein